MVQVNTLPEYREGETILGLMGTPNGNPDDDWVAPDGTVLAIPTTQEGRMFAEAYNYCVDNWIVDDASKSLFTYARSDESFEIFYGGDEPYDNDIEDAIANPPQELADICGDDAMCILDGTVGDLEDARQFRCCRRRVANPGKFNTNDICITNTIDFADSFLRFQFLASLKISDFCNPFSFWFRCMPW